MTAYSSLLSSQPWLDLRAQCTNYNYSYMGCSHPRSELTYWKRQDQLNREITKNLLLKHGLGRV